MYCSLHSQCTVQTSVLPYLIVWGSYGGEGSCVVMPIIYQTARCHVLEDHALDLRWREKREFLSSVHTVRGRDARSERWWLCADCSFSALRLSKLHWPLASQASVPSSGIRGSRCFDSGSWNRPHLRTNTSRRTKASIVVKKVWVFIHNLGSRWRWLPSRLGRLIPLESTHDFSSSSSSCR